MKFCNECFATEGQFHDDNCSAAACGACGKGFIDDCRCVKPQLTKV